MIKPSELRREIQTLLADSGFYKGKIDGDFGPKTYAAINELDIATDAPANTSGAVHRGKASSFADEADVKAFRRCKERGGSDSMCFKVGDNGIGCWGDDTSGEHNDTPMCALPRGDWEPLGDMARGKKVAVTRIDVHGAPIKTVICELRDTLPRYPLHGVVIDLNPGALKAFGLHAPVLVTAEWQWV